MKYLITLLALLFGTTAFANGPYRTYYPRYRQYRVVPRYYYPQYRVTPRYYYPQYRSYSPRYYRGYYSPRYWNYRPRFRSYTPRYRTSTSTTTRSSSGTSRSRPEYKTGILNNPTHSDRFRYNGKTYRIPSPFHAYDQLRIRVKVDPKR